MVKLTLLVFFFALGFWDDCSTESIITPIVLKISASVTDSLGKTGHANILVSMKEGTETVLQNLNFGQYSTLSKAEKGTSVYNALTAHATSSQQEALSYLSTKTNQVKSFWITNQIFIKDADKSLVESLSAFHQVSSIDLEQTLFLDDPNSSVEFDRNMISANGEPEWGINKIKAPAVWSMDGGSNGKGAIVGILDTGVRATHEALKDNYVGNENNGWYDPYTPTPYPYDDQGHGTHVTGTIVGHNGIGVAPGAKWMACKGITSQNTATDSALIACGQFFACPTDYYGNNKDCSKAPHIINNSWGTDRQGSPWYDGVIRVWRAAGIIPVFSAGNSGTSCRTILSPAENKDVISVGATTVNDELALFSSIGPSSYGDIKPDISAPGQDVWSSSFKADNEYASGSGTSMASPHVAGLLALLYGRDKNILFEGAKKILTESAEKNLRFRRVSCDGVGDSEFPSNHFGHGRINALNAIHQLNTAIGLTAPSILLCALSFLIFSLCN